MEINSKQPLVMLDSAMHRLDPQQKTSLRTASSGGENQGSDADRIELSVRGLQIQNLESLVRAAPDVRDAKVEAVRNAVQAGTYNVKGEQIADKILSGSLIDEIF